MRPFRAVDENTKKVYDELVENIDALLQTMDSLETSVDMKRELNELPVVDDASSPRDYKVAIEALTALYNKVNKAAGDAANEIITNAGAAQEDPVVGFAELKTTRATRTQINYRRRRHADCRSNHLIPTNHSTGIRVELIGSATDAAPPRWPQRRVPPGA